MKYLFGLFSILLIFITACEGEDYVAPECSKNEQLLMGSCECKTGYHKEKNECTISVEMRQCTATGSAPENSIVINKEVEVFYENGEWRGNIACPWKCKEGYHQEGDNKTCKENTKREDCSIEGIPTENVSIVELKDIEISWDVKADKWNETPQCEWSCKEEFHYASKKCISNTMMTSCSRSGIPTENTTITESQVEVTWNVEENKWNSPSKCEWSCNEGHKEDNVCVNDKKMLPCSKDGIPTENTTITEDNVEVTWNAEENKWNETPQCEWSCNEGWKKNEAQDACVENNV